MRKCRRERVKKKKQGEKKKTGKKPRKLSRAKRRKKKITSSFRGGRTVRVIRVTQSNGNELTFQHHRGRKEEEFGYEKRTYYVSPKS